MAKGKASTKAAEEILKDGVAENTAEATEGENAAESAAATEGEQAAEPEAEVTRDDVKVSVVVPRFLFTSDVNATHQEFCVNGKIYQIMYDEPVEVPEIVANVVRDAITQRRKVSGLIRAMAGKSKELNKETL